MSSARRCSVSVDLDPLRCYHDIHGLPPPPVEVEQAGLILTKALPRFLDLFARHRVRATFFVVGSDLDTAAGRTLLAQAAAAGHELANHSHTHPYDLARLPRARMLEEVRRCHQALLSLVPGRAPRGFRSPGYDMSPDLLDVLAEMGYQYDSSLLPSPPYYAAKLAAMGRLYLTGWRSRAVLTAPQALLSPADPYRPDPLRPWRRGQATVVELPVAVTPLARMPAIGTFLLLSERLRTYLLSAMRARPFFNLELHGIDLIDARADGVPVPLRGRQPDLRVSLSDKERALRASLDDIAGEREFVPLHVIAESTQRT
jgi:peptidoglycan/xylan/chitin deacetylase (PgdA/CDA1 family)